MMDVPCYRIIYTTGSTGRSVDSSPASDVSVVSAFQILTERGKAEIALGIQFQFRPKSMLSTSDIPLFSAHCSI